MEHSYNQKAYIIQKITQAFEGVTLGQGISLNETYVIDMYGSDAERKKARKGDEKDDWKAIIDRPDLKKLFGIGGLSFFDAEGLRFHLPAYMILAIKEPEADVSESLMFTLTHLSDYQKERFSILNQHQRRAIRKFLIYVRHNGGMKFHMDHDSIDKSLQNYWNK